MKSIALWDEKLQTENRDDKENEGCPSITPYLLEEEGSHPAMIVCPGGAYRGRAYHEGEPVAKWLNSIGVSAFVLNYRVSPHQFPAPLEDAKRAIRIIRHRAAEWGIDTERVGILGFSAGGHLASTLGTQFDDGNQDAQDPIERVSCRPDILVLCYPVISMGTYGHEVSRMSLLGENPQPEMIDLLSNETQVTSNTPPTFLWHTTEDTSVPPENSFLFASALGRHKVPYEIHIFEQGSHGLGLGEGTRETKVWPELCEAWLKARNFVKAYEGFSEYSKLGDLLKDDAATAILKQYWPECTQLPAYTEGATIKHLVNNPLANLNEDKIYKIKRALETLNAK